MTAGGGELALRGEPLAGRRVTVMGLGLLGGGVEVVRALADAGARVAVTDLRGADELAPSVAALADRDVTWTLGEHRDADFEEAEVVVANPAVPPASPYLARARAAGAAITSETELFLEACPARLALVTGTQGKSTTSHLAAGLLEHCGIRAHLGGNIGRSLLGALTGMRPDDAVVLEVSSYQLEALPDDVAHLRARVAAVCVTNVLADHLERHGSPAAYAAAKRRILELAGPDAVLVLPRHDERVRDWDVDPGRARWVSSRAAAELCVRDGSFVEGGETAGAADDLALVGTFQLDNALSALGLARALGASREGVAAAWRHLGGLAHRLEDLGAFGGHRVWDNGVSTTPDSTVSALRSLDGPTAVLVGGQAKELALDELVRTCAVRAARVVTFGASGDALAEALEAGGATVHRAGDVADAVRTVYAHMAAGEALLFSPACASFDAFLNFEQRAGAFRAALPERDTT